MKKYISKYFKKLRNKGKKDGKLVVEFWKVIKKFRLEIFVESDYLGVKF